MEPVRTVRAGGDARRLTNVPSPVGLPTDLQHGDEPRRLVSSRRSTPPAVVVVRPVPGRPRRGTDRGSPRSQACRVDRTRGAGGEPVRRHLGVPLARRSPGEYQQRRGGGARPPSSGPDHLGQPGQVRRSCGRRCDGESSEGDQGVGGDRAGGSPPPHRDELHGSARRHLVDHLARRVRAAATAVPA